MARKKVHKKEETSCRQDVGNGGDYERRKENKNVDLESIGAVGVDPGDVEKRQEAEREALGAQGLRKNWVETMCPLCRV